MTICSYSFSDISKISKISFIFKNVGDKLVLTLWAFGGVGLR